MRKLTSLGIGLTIIFINVNSVCAQPLWNLAKENKDVLTISTLFIAQDVRDHLSTTSGLDDAVNWCKQTGITRVFIESFRDGYYAEREALNRVKERFLKEGIDVAGCVTTTKVGRGGTGGWEVASCYSSKQTHDELRKIFEYTASIFNLIMIDDFLFTECECEECIKAKGNQSWSEFRTDLLVEVSREHIIKPARAVNPDVKLIIKYPLWYDSFQERGYDVIRETREYDFIWVGTETRDYDYKVRPGGEVQYNAFFITRWMGGIGGEKLGGGWVDALGTTPETYLEQARQTILGNGKEIMLFHYGDLIRDSNFYDGKPGTPKANIEAFRKELPGLINLAKIIKDKPLQGIHMPKIPKSDPQNEKYIFSFFGMLGLPLIPAHSIDEGAKSAIFTVHAIKDPEISKKIHNSLNSGNRVLITDGLAKLLTNQVLLEHKNLTILKVAEDPKSLLDLKRQELKMIRDKLMSPLGLKFDAPNKVSLYLPGGNLVIIENFNDEKVEVAVEFPAVNDFKIVLTLPQSGTANLLGNESKSLKMGIPPRSLVAFEYK